MEKLTAQTSRLMNERFGSDNVIALATVQDGVPYVRYVNALYRDQSFYIITYGLSRKMRQIAVHPMVSIAGNWFTAQGTGVDLGYFEAPENREIAALLRNAFAAWIDNGHNDFSDENTRILCIHLTQGELFSNGTCFHIDFTE